MNLTSVRTPQTPDAQETRPALAAPRPLKVLTAEQADPAIVNELVKILLANPRGLRRWSVMNAIRRDRSRTARPVSLRFETEVERVFRSLCADYGEGRPPDQGEALFYRPEGKAGEVWAVRPDRAQAWLGKPAQAG